jgi:hypothetical protein
MIQRRITALLVICALSAVACRAMAAENADADKDLLKGHATILNVAAEGGRSLRPDTNVGGLLIIQIPDSGSRPPQDMSVKTSRTFQRLGQLRGINTDKKTGRALMGGGYTWFLFTPKNESKQEEVEVKYTPNGGGGAPKTRTYKVEVKAAE